MAKVCDIVPGAKFTRLTVIRREGNNTVCRCDCGKITRPRNTVLGVLAKSCGCLRGDRNVTHGLWKTNERLYNIWKCMHARCYDSTSTKWNRYGGRGISVCDEWHDAATFAKWANSAGYSQSLTIERIDVNGNYHPDNCCWIPAGLQADNRTTAVVLTAWGETKPLREWVKDERCRVADRKRVRSRVADGWTAEEALTTPVRPCTVSR